MILRRWLREFTEFFFQKGNALNLAIAVVVGTQFQQIVDAISKDLLMPLLNPLVRGGDWQNLVIPYYGGDLAIGKILDVILNSLIVGWALFFIIKAINRSQRTLEGGVKTIRESVNPKQGNDGN
ncbi:MscL family protein [Synechococcus sp. PROS-7-1]|uniref:MscL family protein n=1 Tax=Synechococcus sp. PROS-7-1 TaxID=1442556 RepID=UPI001646C014|nr:MscL family protein [Synechococcus sp. PROS-7-1]